MFEILSPVIIRISGDHVAIFIPTGEQVVIRKVIRIDSKRGNEEEDKEKSGKWAENVPELLFIPVIEICRSLCHEEIEKGENWEKVTETNIEITSDTYHSVEKDKKHGEILSDAFLERMNEDGVIGGDGFISKGFDDTENGIDRGDEEEKQEREGFLG